MSHRGVCLRALCAFIPVLLIHQMHSLHRGGRKHFYRPLLPTRSGVVLVLTLRHSNG